MQLCYNGKPICPANAAEVTARWSPVRAPSGRVVRYRGQIGVRGYIEGTSQADLSAKGDALFAALAVGYGDLVLKTDGGADTDTALHSNKSLTGVVITDGPNFTEAMNAEYVNRRTFEFVGEAEYVASGADNAVLSFTETITRQGNGGPEYVWFFPIGPDTTPVRQTTVARSLCRTTQSGQSVGHTDYPSAPSPYWPRYLVNPATAVTVGSPRRNTKGLIEYPKTWTYQYESDVVLDGLPATPPL